MKNRLLFCILVFIFFSTTSAQQFSGVSVNLFTYLSNNERALEDGVGVLFNGQSDTVDLSDARKLQNPLENIAILRNNILLGIEQRTTLDTIPLTLWNLQQRDYELEIFTLNITDAYLENVSTHTREYIGTGDTIRYRFTNTIANSPRDSSIRFWVIFGKIPVVNICGGNNHPRHHHRNEHRMIRLYPNPVVGSYINLKMNNLQAGRCKVTIIGGEHLLTYEFIHADNCNERINTSGLQRGRYYMMIEDEEGWKETRQIEVD